jgi:hypothetical protein
MVRNEFEFTVRAHGRLNLADGPRSRTLRVTVLGGGER